MKYIKPRHLLIIGYGFVGGAVARNLTDAGHTVDILDLSAGYDLKYSNAEGAIVCVDTPTTETGCDDSNVRAAITSAQELLGVSAPVLVKSTVTPDLVEHYPDNVTVSPEFLRAQHADQDFANQPFMVLGGDIQGQRWWSDVFTHIMAHRVPTSRAGACWIKYLHNTWLATKVVFFHEMRLAADNHDQIKDFQSAITALAKYDQQIGASHMTAPNQDGTMGYGGACFPKDMQAMAGFSDADIIKEVMAINERLNKTRL